MIVVTGGLGFIGSHLIKKLNDEGREDIIIVERNLNSLYKQDKFNNIKGCKYEKIIE